MLTINVAEIGYEEGILIARLAELVVDGLDTTGEGIGDELLGNGGAIEGSSRRCREPLG